MQQSQVIGIYNGNLALFNVIETECKSKKKRTIGIKKEFSFVKTINSFKNAKAPIDSSLIINDNTCIHDYELTLPSVDPTVFRFGKYKNTKILECADKKYLMWYFPNITHPDIKEKVLEMLSDEYIYMNNRFYNKHINITSEDTEIINKCNSDEAVFIRFDKNLNENGELSYGDSKYIIIKFQNYKPLSFNGIHYSAAENSKDHYIKVKNRELKITDYELNYKEDINRYELIVKNFEIIS